MNVLRRSIGALAMLAALGVALGVAACQKTAPAATDSEMSLGDPKAKITVVEYASVGCPFCAQFSNEVFPGFKARYVDTGKARYVFREVLVGGGDEVSLAAAGFLMARCAGKDKYFPIIEQIFRAQSSIYQSGDVRGGLLEIARASGMNEAQFTSCVSNDQSLIALNARSEQAAKDGVGNTPTFFINGKKVFEGLPTADQFDKAIQAAQ